MRQVSSWISLSLAAAASIVFLWLWVPLAGFIASGGIYGNVTVMAYIAGVGIVVVAAIPFISVLLCGWRMLLQKEIPTLLRWAGYLGGGMLALFGLWMLYLFVQKGRDDLQLWVGVSTLVGGTTLQYLVKSWGPSHEDV